MIDQSLLISYWTIDIAGICILLILYFNSKKRRDIMTPDQRLFLLIILSTIVILVFDIGMWTFNLQTFKGARTLNIIVTTIYYIVNPMPGFFWVIYVDYKIHENTKRLKKIIGILSVPLMINLVLSIISCFTNCTFWITGTNSYLHGNLYLLVIILSYLNLFIAVILIYLNRKLLSSKKMISMMCLSLIVMVTSIIQSIFFGLSIIWISLSLAILIAYLSMQNDALLTDYLTNLYNRRKLTNFLSFHLTSSKRTSNIIGIMLDIDKFKLINDNYGHNEGDKALIQASSILRRSVGANDLLVRYAGDEFIIIVVDNDLQRIDDIIGRIEKEIKKDQKNGVLIYPIHFSWGAMIIEPDNKVSVEEFLRLIDQRMYSEKEKNMGSNV